ncbi:MAG: hypothetical protein ABI670_22710 [Chloroflexota bacterium]
MTIIHEAYLFRPDNFAREILPYAKALANSSDGEKLLLDHVIERFDNIPTISELAMEYGSWNVSDLYDAKYLYESPPEAHGGGRANVGRLLVFMIYGYLHPVPSQFGLGGRWGLMEEVLNYPLGWHSSDTASVIHGHSFGFFAQSWIANELDTTDIQVTIPPSLGYWEKVTTGSTAAQIGWLDYPDVKRFFDKLAREESKLPGIKTPHDPSRIEQVYHDTLQMLRSASEEECGLCIITSG